jgi:hypothetical protein
MKLQLPSPISDSLLLLVVQVVLRHVARDWGSAIPFGIEALPFPLGLGLRHSPSTAAGGCCAVESSTRAAPPDECHDRKINIESQTVQQIGNETYVWRGLVLLIPLTIEGLDQNTLSNCDCCSQSVGGIAQ